MKSRPIVVVCREDGTVAEMLPRFGEGAARALEEGRIFVGRRRAIASDAVRAGEQVAMYPPRAPPSEQPRILLEKRGVVAACKPAQMATIADHRGAEDSLEATVARMLGRKSALHATSRLDVGVSGVVLFACDDDARKRLARARDEGRYARHYVAIASQAPVPERGAWTAPIGRAQDARLRQAFGRDAVRAETDYSLVAAAPKGALLAVEPQTGRTHQIRVHAAHAGAALWGDAAYGGPTRIVGASGSVAAVDRIALHAAWVEVSLDHGDTLYAEAPPPDELVALWTRCGGDAAAFAAALMPVYPSPR